MLRNSKYWRKSLLVLESIHCSADIALALQMYCNFKKQITYKEVHWLEFSDLDSGLVSELKKLWIIGPLFPYLQNSHSIIYSIYYYYLFYAAKC